MRDVIRRTARVSRGVSRRPTAEEIAAGAREYSWLPDGHEEGDITIEVDLSGLFRSLAVRALSSKGGKAVEAGGLIVARVVRGSKRRVRR